MKLFIIFNNLARKGFKSAWGFSFLVKNNDDFILFDTGCDGDYLFYNLKKFKIDVKKISKIVISHKDWDHVGGLFSLINKNNKLTVYLPKCFSKTFTKELRSRVVVKNVNKLTKIYNEIFISSSFKYDYFYEQSLFLITSKGVLILTGCSHPGVEVFINEAKTLGKIWGVIGGFHDNKNIKIFNNLELIAPMHCSKNLEIIKKTYPKAYKLLKAGDIIDFK